MSTAADPTAAIAEYLSTELEAVTGTVADGLRVFRPNLPKGEDEFMPAACVIVAPSGGSALFGRTFLPIATPIIDCYCYGGTHLQADNVARSVSQALQQLQRSVVEGVCLCWARITAEPKSMVDQDTLWPLAIVSAQVMHFTTPTA